MGWKNVDPTKINFDEEGKVLEGKLEGYTVIESLDVNNYSLTTTDGEHVTFLGTTVLDKTLPQYKGQVVRITYKGESKTSGNRKVKNFQVDVWEGGAEPTEDTAADAPKVKKGGK